MNQPSNPPVSVVVPVYASRETIRPLVERIGSVLSAAGREYEVILVNDGSPDASWEMIQDVCGSNPHVRGIDLMRNYGQHNALLAGIRAARYEITVTLDDDLQNPPEEIPQLLQKLAEDNDVVYGWPGRRQHGLLRTLASQMTKKVLKDAMGVGMAHRISAFRAFRTDLREAFHGYQGPYVSIDVLLTWAASRFSSVTVRHDPRTSGESHYALSKLVLHAFNMMTGFSTWPLRLASIMGFGFMLFGFGVLLYVVGRYFVEGGSVPGFPFLASIIALFSGAQLFALGIIGEYLARMHVRMMDRPSYAVRRTTPSR